MNGFEDIFLRPWSCRTMPCSWTIKTKSNGVLPGHGNEQNCPLWRVQIVPFFYNFFLLQRLSRVDLKGEKSHTRAPLHLFYFSCLFMYSICLSLGFLSLTRSVFPSNFLLTYFQSYLFSRVHDRWWKKKKNTISSFHLRPSSVFHFALLSQALTGL